jgi:hypothetical protein
MKKMFIFLAAVTLLSGAVSAAGREGEAYKIKSDTEKKIQSQVLDTMLGSGRAHVFLEMDMQLVTSSEEVRKTGVGKSHKGRVKSSDDAKAAKEDSGDYQEQTASQEKKSFEVKQVCRLELGGMKLRVLYDSSLPAAKIKAVKKALAALYPGKLKEEDIVFVPAEFAQEEFIPEGSAGE